MDANYYANKSTQMLSNGEFYKKIPENHDRRTMQKIINLVLQHKDTSSVTDKETLFLTDFEYRDSVFYGLPKIHKSKIIGEAIKIQNSDYITCLKPEDLTFRPIVGGPKSPTQRQLLDILLKPLLHRGEEFCERRLGFF